MTPSIKITADQLRLLSLFEKIAKTSARDCIDSDEGVIFVVEPGKMGQAIGKGGMHVKALREKIKKQVDLVEYNEDPAKFLRSALNDKMIRDVSVEKGEDGVKRAVVVVVPGKKGLVVGREGRNAERARLLAKRYFDIAHVSINNPERATLEI